MDNFNISKWIINAIKAPLQLLFNWKTYDILILEMGIDSPDSPKNMSYLLKIAQPDIGIFLNVNSVHSFNFDHLVDSKLTGPKRQSQIIQLIGQEKAKLINSLPSTGTAIINQDDPTVVATTQICLAKKLTLSHNSASDLKITKTISGPQGFNFEFKFQNSTYSIKLPRFVLPEIYNVSLASAFLVGITLELAPKTIINNIQKHFHLPPGRSSLLHGINDSLIIDSSYNSSPTPTQEMLHLLAKFPSPKIAIIGDMRELGDQSPIEHQTLFKQALQSADLIIGIGPETQKYFKPSKEVQTFQHWWQAKDFLLDYLSNNPHSSILFKGSQNTIYLEELIKTILSNPSDQQLLCRQTPYWLHQKQSFYDSKHQ